MPFSIFPATEWILVVSRDSLMVSGGRIVGRRFAIMVFPAPGGPIMITLCPPAAAISKARLYFPDLLHLQNRNLIFQAGNKIHQLC